MTNISCVRAEIARLLQGKYTRIECPSADRGPIEAKLKGLRKEDHVLPAIRRMEKRGAYGVYFIFKSMEQGRTFRISVPKYPTQDPNDRILAHQQSRFPLTSL